MTDALSVRRRSRRARNNARYLSARSSEARIEAIHLLMRTRELQDQVRVHLVASDRRLRAWPVVERSD